MINSDYLHCCFDRPELDAKLRAAQETLYSMSFDIIACRGVSGLLFSSLLAYKMRKGLAVVRKREHTSHSCCKVEGHLPTQGEKWIIVDDFISSGSTVAEIITKLGKGAISGFQGAYLYKLHDYRTVRELRRSSIIADSLDVLSLEGIKVTAPPRPVPVAYRELITKYLEA